VALGLLGGAFVAIALFLWFRSDPARAVVPRPDVAAPPSPGAAPTMTSSAAATGPTVGGIPIDELPEPIRRFLEATPYPATSGRLTRANEDLLYPNRRSERPLPIPDTLGDDPDQVVTWLFTTDRWAYVGPETVHVRLEVRRGGEPLDVSILSATATREGDSGVEGAGEPLALRFEDGRYLGELSLARMADHFGPIVLDVAFEYEPGRRHSDRIRIFSTPADHIPGRLTEVRDSLQDGNLRVEVGVDVGAPGFYRIDANLYDANGEPVAFAFFKGELASGAQQVPLDVYGKVLRDAGVPGPYTIGEVRGYRFLDGQYPDREILPSSSETWTTSAWTLDSFRDDPDLSPHELHMAELMLDDVKKGVPLFAPPAADDDVAPRPADDDAEVTVDDAAAQTGPR